MKSKSHFSIRTESELFLIALAFLTRLPLPAWVDWSADKQRRAARHFPLAGYVVAAVGAGSFALGLMLWSAPLAVLLSMAATIWLTGALHEDGWADACDGLGGGATRARALEIMKDSRVGSFGVVGLVLMLLTKAAALSALATLGGAVNVVAALFSAHALSRWAAVTLIAGLPYARADDASAKSSNSAGGLADGDLLVASLTGFAPLLLLSVWSAVVAGLVSVAVATVSGRYLRRRLGGYTGDTLGAVQQLAELAIYLGILAVWNCI